MRQSYRAVGGTVQYAVAVRRALVIVLLGVDITCYADGIYHIRHLMTARSGSGRISIYSKKSGHVCTPPVSPATHLFEISDTRIHGGGTRASADVFFFCIFRRSRSTAARRPVPKVRASFRSCRKDIASHSRTDSTTSRHPRRGLKA